MLNACYPYDAIAAYQVAIAIALFELSSKTTSLAAQNPHAHSTILKVKGT